MSLEGSICSDREDNNPFEELVLSPQPEPFPLMQEEENDFKDFFSQQQIENPQPRKTQKKRRGNKKDDFDYNKYIDRELNKMDTTKLDCNKKKKLI